MQFAVADVAVNKKNNYRPRSHSANMAQLVGAPVEACSQAEHPTLYLASDNVFVSAVHHAFAEHWPLQITPDAVWLTLTQGLAKHVELNAEKLRQHFVAHEGKVKITVQRDGFVRGNANNDWPGVFDEFSTKIKEHVGDKVHRLIVADYSTTSPIDKAASEVVLMDAMKQYFEYGVSTACGIPFIDLTGTVEDWESIRDKVKQWSDWGLGFWVAGLTQILDQFVNAAKGQADREWWSNFYKYHEAYGSGESSRITGWVNWLFPYIRDRINSRIGQFGKDRYDGLTTEAYPKSLAKVPFTWNYYGQDFPYEFLAGLSGVVQDSETMMVKPISGWAVRDTAVTKPRSY